MKDSLAGNDPATLGVDAVLAGAAPSLSIAQAVEIAAGSFGIKCKAEILTSERDQNFLLVTPTGIEYVLKVSNPAEDIDITDFQTQALLHVAATDPTVPIQRVVLAPDGGASIRVNAAGIEQTVRLMTFIKGVSSHAAPRTSAQRRRIGQILANLGLALRDFTHPAASRSLLWDIKHASNLRNLLPHIPTAGRRRLVAQVLDNFDSKVKSQLLRLRTQIIHNDFNAYNILVDPDCPDLVTAILDFGDMVDTALIVDVAVGAAYQFGAAGDRLQPAAEVVSAFHEVRPLLAEEIHILPDLISTRFAVAVLITEWRAALYPENRAYILKNTAHCWAGLEYLADVPTSEFHAYFQRACRME
jgi:hydroxylysine kinase